LRYWLSQRPSHVTRRIEYRLAVEGKKLIGVEVRQSWAATEERVVDAELGD